MSHVLPISFSGSGEKFLARLKAIPDLLEHCTKQMTALKLNEAWRQTRGIQVFEEPRQGRLPFWYDHGTDTIQLYPLLFGKRPDADIFSAFGKRHWHRNLSQAERLQWINATVFPDVRTLEKFKDKIKAGTDYNTLLASFTQPDERLVVIHLINALIKNHTTAAQAQHIDLDHYAPVSDFLSAEKPYTARPLLKTFRPQHENVDSYAQAFGEFCVNKGKFLSSLPAMEKLYRTLFHAVTYR